MMYPTGFLFANPINVLDYGIVPNNSAAASTNTAALQALLNPAATGPTGDLVFPNTTGADIYSFNGTVPIRPGMRINLMSCTIAFIGSATANDVNTGLFYVLSDFSLENGTITTAVNTALGVNAGAAVQIGARGVGFYFTVWDSTQNPSQGRITLKNLVISANNTGGQSNAAIQMLGGLSNVVLENISINCNSAVNISTAPPAAASASQSGVTFTTASQTFTAGLLVYLTGTAPGGFTLNTAYYVSATGLTATACELSLTPGGSVIATTSSASCTIQPALGVEGIYYEWGWAQSPGTLYTSQNSFGHNMTFENIRVINATGVALAITGGYNCTVDGFYSGNCAQTFVYSVGQAMFYLPWSGVDDAGAKRNMTLRNIVGENCLGVGIQLAGSNMQSGFTPQQQTDLMSFDLDGFAIVTTFGTAMAVSGPITARNGYLVGTGGGGVLILNDDCIDWSFENTKVYGGTTGAGVRVDVAGTGAWTRPPLSSLSWSANTVTATTLAPVSSLSTVFSTTISGASPSGYNGSVTATVTGTNTFTYPLATNPGTETTPGTYTAPARPKFGRWHGGQVAGNLYGFTFNNMEYVKIEGCRIGYNALYDGHGNETVQTIGVLVDSGCNGVVCDSNFVTTSGGVAYSITSTNSSGCNIVNPLGTVTSSNQWDWNGASYTNSTNMGSKTSYPNLGYKYLGKQCYNSSTNKMFYAQGGTPTSAWISLDGATTITPS